MQNSSDPLGRLHRGLGAWVEQERPFFSFNALSMYLLTLIAELPVILARIFIIAWIASIVVLIEDQTIPKWSDTWVLLGLIPTFWSMLALIIPDGSAYWWQIRAGGRKPSGREQLAYQDAIELLQANSDRPLHLPRRWFVLDNPHPDAGVIGNALMLSRGLLETDHLPAVLAHELGHLATSDGRLTAAVNRLMIFSSPLTAGAAEHEQPQSGAPRRLPGEGLMRFRHRSRDRRRLLVSARPFHPLPLRQGRPRPLAHQARMGRLLARTRVQSRPVRRQARPSRGARRVPGTARPHPRPPRPTPLPHRAHPPADRAADRPAPHQTRRAAHTRHTNRANTAVVPHINRADATTAVHARRQTAHHLKENAPPHDPALTTPVPCTRCRRHPALRWE
jgi:hypothetical protein